MGIDPSKGEGNLWAVPVPVGEKGDKQRNRTQWKDAKVLSKKRRFANCWIVELILDRQPGIAWNTPGLLGTTST